nr:unnamed protein product [Spirometra erinaceieuropaei]
MVASVLPWLEREQYDDIPVERVAYGNCGYLLCLKPVGNQLKQTYRISSASRKVYEVGDRKYFCSDWCYRASCYLRKQIPAEPAWCRPLNPGPMVNLRFLPPTAHGLPGKKILDAMNRMRLDDSNDESGSGESDSVGSDNDSSFDEGEEDIPEDVDEAFGRVVKIDHTKLPKNVCASKAQIRKMWSEPLPPPKNIEIIERKPSSLELPQVPTSEQFTATPQRPSSPTGDLATFVTTRLSEWITPEAIRALGSETEPSAAELEKLPKPVKFEKVAAFLRGSEPSSFDPETDPASDHPLGSTVMPLVDSISQKQYRLRLLLESLLPSLKSILFRLALPLSDVFENLQNFVAHFSLTNRNLHLKPEEALLTSAALLYLLRTYVICLRTEDDSLERLSTIVSGLGVDAKKFFASLENIVAQLKSTPEEDLPD